MSGEIIEPGEASLRDAEEHAAKKAADIAAGVVKPHVPELIGAEPADDETKAKDPNPPRTGRRRPR